jgi:hypothetical protein
MVYRDCIIANLSETFSKKPRLTNVYISNTEHPAVSCARICTEFNKFSGLVYRWNEHFRTVKFYLVFYAE